MGCGASSEVSSSASKQKENDPSSPASSPPPPTSSNCTTVDDTQNRNDQKNNDQNKKDGDMVDAESTTSSIIKSEANKHTENNINHHVVDENAAQILPASRNGEDGDNEGEEAANNNNNNHASHFTNDEVDNEASFQLAPGPSGTTLNNHKNNDSNHNNNTAISGNNANKVENNNNTESTPSPFNNLTPQELKKLKREKQQRQQEIDELQISLSAKNKRIDWDELSDKFPFEKEDASAKREREILLATIREEENNCESSISLNTLIIGLKLHLGQAAESSVKLDYPIFAATKRAIELTTSKNTASSAENQDKDPLTLINLDPEHEQEQFRLILRFLREYFELYQIYEESGIPIEASERKLSSLLEEQEKFVDLDVDADDFYDDDDDDDDDDETDMKDIQGNYKNLVENNKNLLKLDLEEFKKAGPLLEKWGAKISESLYKTFEEILSEKNNPGTEAASSASPALLLFDDLAEWAMKQSK